MTMTLYFIIQGAAIWLLNRGIRALAREERLEKAGKPARNRLTRGFITANRVATLKQLQESPRCQAEIAKDPALQATIATGALSVTEFIDCTSEEVMQRLLEFPLDAWLTILLTTVVMGIVLGWSCIPPLVIIFFFVGVPALSCLVFILWYAAQRCRYANGTPGLILLPALHRALWPLSLLGFPFSFGYVLWDKKPSDARFLTAIQVHIFNFCFLTIWAWAAQGMSFYYIGKDRPGPIVGDLYPGDLAAIHCVLSLLVLVLIPALEHIVVLVLAFPPYLSQEEEDIALQVLRDFPNGVCDDDAAPKDEASVKIVSATGTVERM